VLMLPFQGLFLEQFNDFTAIWQARGMLEPRRSLSRKTCKTALLLQKRPCCFELGSNPQLPRATPPTTPSGSPSLRLYTIDDNRTMTSASEMPSIAEETPTNDDVSRMLQVMKSMPSSVRTSFSRPSAPEFMPQREEPTAHDAHASKEVIDCALIQQHESF
jgi:hypothetical protein